MKRYVVGFLFDTNDSEDPYDFDFLVIRKNRPEWQKNHYNGIGGKVEEEETPLEAMTREFKEETNGDFDNWHEFFKVSGDGYELFVFKGFINNIETLNLKSMTDEPISVFGLSSMLHLAVLPSARWMIMAALDEHINRLSIECTEPL